MSAPNLFDGPKSKKFWMFLICLTVGTAAEILVPTGISAQFVALLLGLPAAYGLVNVANKKVVLGGVNEKRD